MMNWLQMAEIGKKVWRALRHVTGDDAYARYLNHWREHHAHASAAPMSRKDFHRAETDRKWNSIKRCC